MKKIYITLLVCFAAMAAMAIATQPVQTFVRADQNAAIGYPADNAKISQVKINTQQFPSKAPAKKVQEHDWEGTDTVAYFAVVKSFIHNWAFSYDGGDDLLYTIGIARDGNKVTFANFFNVYNPTDYTPSHDLPFSGIYDAEAKTITVETPVPVMNYMGTYYPGVEMNVGTFDEGGAFTEGGPLVFDVEGDFESITARDHMYIRYQYGDLIKYKTFTAFKKSDDSPAKIIKLSQNINFGATYAGQTLEQQYSLVNAGGTAVDYVLKIDQEGEDFASSSMSGTIDAYSRVDIPFSFTPSEPGEYEGLTTLSIEDQDPILIQLEGVAEATPDYSPVVVAGDFTFSTSYAFPFEIVEDTEITDPANPDETIIKTIAKSGTNGSYGKSWLEASFTVPSGKLGRVSFNGKVTNNDWRYWYRITSYIYVDGEEYLKTNNTGYYSALNTEEKSYTNFDFGPGTHSIRFFHDQDYYTGYADDGTFIFDLKLDLEDQTDYMAEVAPEAVDLGYILLDNGGSAIREGKVILSNKGSLPITVDGITSDNDCFYGVAPEGEIASMESVEIPVGVKTETSGVKEGNITIKTTAGDFVVAMKATVIDTPDYSQIVDEGIEYMTFTADQEYPFIIEDGKAYNITSKNIDNALIFSTLTIDLEIPDGKIGTLSWKGHVWGTPAEDYYTGEGDYADYGGVEIHNGNTNLSAAWYDKDLDASSESLSEINPSYADFMTFAPGMGKGTVKFFYRQGGNGKFFGEDRLEIHNIKFVVEDAVPYKVECDKEEVVFEPIFVGPQRYTTATVKLTNRGTEMLKVTDIPEVGPFYGIVPTMSAQLNKSIDVTLWFYPTEEGEFTEDLVINTTAGPVTVKCKATTKDTEGIIYPGDFEDAAYGWTLFERDGDGYNWNLGSNLWGDRKEYCHTGVECLGSLSYSYDGGALKPDNWTVSCPIEIPEEGAKLTYYVSAFSPDDFQEHYSVYVSTDNSQETLFALEPMIEETINEPVLLDPDGYATGWLYREIDLKEFAGKTIYIVFRHHDCVGQYILRLDDVFVYNVEDTGVRTLTNPGGNIVRQEVFGVDGTNQTELKDGINIVRTTFDNGMTVTSKIVIRK